MHLIYLIQEFHNLSWITEINELFHVILIYLDTPVIILQKRKMTIDRTVNVSYVQMKVWWVLYRCTVRGCVVLFRWDMIWGKTVLVSGCFGAQWSVAPARGQQFKESVSWVWGVQSAFLSSFSHSGGVKFLGIVESYVWGRGKIHYQE